MLIVLRSVVTEREREELTALLAGCTVEETALGGRSVLCVGGDTLCVDTERVAQLPYVQTVEDDRSGGLVSHGGAVKFGNLCLGDGSLCVVAGPCCIESAEQTLSVARRVRDAGASVLRGGAFKPRTSPYTFAGLREEGLRLLCEAGAEVKMPVVSEILDARHLPLFENVDVIQVGARNMQNFELLHALGTCGKPVLLKRGAGSTLDELLYSAEHVMKAGNERVILCERGIRTFEPSTRFTFDVSAIPLLKQRTGLPVIADPSHACGRADIVEALTLAAVAAGADGVMVEVHEDPAHALCDGLQALTPDRFERLCRRLDVLKNTLKG